MEMQLWLLVKYINWNNNVWCILTVFYLRRIFGKFQKYCALEFTGKILKKWRLMEWFRSWRRILSLLRCMWFCSEHRLERWNRTVRQPWWLVPQRQHPQEFLLLRDGFHRRSRNCLKKNCFRLFIGCGRIL